jgi:hypothetical protein
MDWITGFIDHLYTPLGTTGFYSITAKLHNSQFTTKAVKHFPACCDLTIRFLTTAYNSGDSSSPCAHINPSPTLAQNWLPALSSGTLNLILFGNCQLSPFQLFSIILATANSGDSLSYLKLSILS